MSNDKIKVAILGVGNCASSFVQGIEHYSNSDDEDGLISDVIGGYKVSDIEVVAAYDINSLKVGKDLSEAIFAEPNNTIKFCDVPKTGVTVQPGVINDGVGKFVKDIINTSPDSDNFEDSLMKSGAEILLPTRNVFTRLSSFVANQCSNFCNFPELEFSNAEVKTSFAACNSSSSD